MGFRGLPPCPCGRWRGSLAGEFTHRQRKDADELVELVMETLKEAIATEGHVKINGFGNFVVRQKTDRKGRNPQTGETITISSRKVLTFKPSVILKSRINQG